MADSKPDLETSLARLERIIGSFENEPDVAVRERALELVEVVDAVHRELVWRVGQRVHEADEALFTRLLEDPIASVLFEMYGLVAPEEKPDQDVPAAFIGLGALEASIPRPFSWFAAATLAEISEGSLFAKVIEGERVLLTRVGDDVHAYIDKCPGSPLTLDGGTLEGTHLICPWHGCRFDVATGVRLDRAGDPLARVQSTLRDGEVRVGLRAGKVVA